VEYIRVNLVCWIEEKARCFHIQAAYIKDLYRLEELSFPREVIRNRIPDPVKIDIKIDMDKTVSHRNDIRLWQLRIRFSRFLGNL
jgi:preprotein translocase subunit SecB